MATLQKIRSRGGILVAIVIGTALFAFIVGDLFSSGGSISRSSQSEMAVIADESISITQFQKRVKHNENLALQMSGRSALTVEQQETVRENTWQEIVQEIVMDKEYNNLGIDVSSDELFKLIYGDNPSPIITQLFQDENGMVDKTRVISIIKQLIDAPDGTPEKAYWLNIEEQIKTSRKLEKYNELLQKSLYTTNARAKQIFEGSARKVDFSYVVKKYNTVPDSLVSINKSEINDYYNSNKHLFQQEETRKIQYVTFNVEPSEKDRAVTKKEIEKLKKEFNSIVDNKSFVDINSDIKFNSYFFKKGENTNEELDKFMFSAKKGDIFGPYEEENSFKVAKVNDIKMLPDSVRARHILIQPINQDYNTAKVKADSLANVLRKGANFDKMAREISADKQSAVNGGDLGWFRAQKMVQAFSEACFSAKKNEIKVVLTQFGAHIIQVTGKAKLEKKVQMAIVANDIITSQETFNKIYADAARFAESVENTNSFSKSVEKTGVTKRIGANIRKNDKAIAGLANPRELVKSIYNTQKVHSLLKDRDGSAIFTLENQYVIAVVTEINEKGTSPIEKVTSQIERVLKRKKKAKIISKQLTSASKESQSLLSIAQKEKLEVKDASDISFESFQIPGAGIEPKVIANAVMSPKGKISLPIVGNQGVYIININNITNDQINDSAIKMTKDQLQNTLTYRMLYQGAQMQALIENANIDDKRYKFY